MFFSGVQTKHMCGEKDSDEILGIVLGILGVAAAIKASEKNCRYCLKKVVRGYIALPILWE